MLRQLAIENSARTVETVFNERDFEDLLQKYLGSDVALYWKEVTDKYQEEIRYLQEEIDTLREELKEVSYDQ